MLAREIITVYFEKSTKHTNRMWAEMQLLYDKQVVYIE
jgi:hypothetical protein